MTVNWSEVWAFLWPILKQGLIAALVSVLGLLGYDRIVPSRFARRSTLAGSPEQFIAHQQAQGADERARQMVQGVKLGRRDT